MSFVHERHDQMLLSHNFRFQGSFTSSFMDRYRFSVSVKWTSNSNSFNLSARLE